MTTPSSAADRRSFQRQPARAILVDLSPPLDGSSCGAIHEALSNTLTLVHHLLGPQRLPLLSIIILGNYPECILPLQPVKGNFSRVMAALAEFKSLTRSIVARHHVRACFLEGLQEALAQFKRLSQNSKQGAGTSPEFPSQIEITLITARSPPHLHDMVERIVHHLELVQLRKISAVVITNPDRLVGPGGLLGGSTDDGNLSGEYEDRESGHVTTSKSDLAMNILDVTVVDNDPLSLQSSFRSWLHDCGTDTEHLHLTLPSTPPNLLHPHSEAAEMAEDVRAGEEEEEYSWGASCFDDAAGGAGGRGREVVLKCDIHERIINPLTAFDAKIGDQFSLHISPPASQPAHHGGRGTALPMAIPTYKLRAIYTVPAEGVCESVVFGVPLILRPTSCWKLEWEELESNQQFFHTFCKLLTEKNLVLIAQGDHTPSPLTPYFLVLPSPSTNSLLIKAIAPGELLLPSDQQPLEEQAAGDGGTVRKTIEKALDMLEHHESYNPLLIQSGLHEVLSSLSQPRRGGSLRGGHSAPPRSHSAGGGRGRGRGATSKTTFQPPVHEPPQSTKHGTAIKRARGATSGRSLGTHRRGYNKGYLELKQ